MAGRRRNVLRYRVIVKAVQVWYELGPIRTSGIGRYRRVSDIYIRKAQVDDCEVIVSFIRMMLMEISDMGGHPFRPNEF